MHLRLMTGVCLVACLVAFGCEGLKWDQYTQPAIIADPSHPHEVPVGYTFSIEIPGTRTVGCQWVVVENSDPAVADLLGAEYRAERKEKDALEPIDTPGSSIFTFRATAEGQTRIVFAYKSDEPDAPALDTRTFDITAKIEGLGDDLPASRPASQPADEASDPMETEEQPSP